MAAVDLRYARALAQVVSEQRLDAAATEAQLRGFSELLDGNAELREALANPSIAEAQKLRVLDGIVARTGTSRAVRNFIALVAHHERLHELRGMIDAFHQLAEEATRMCDAEVTSAHPLDEANRRLLEQKIAAMTGGEHVKATYREDPTLLGGAIVRLGSTVYDGSVRAQLAQLRERLINAA